jgi:hypothetical protein
MKVKELIESLNKLDPNKVVIIYDADEHNHYLLSDEIEDHPKTIVLKHVGYGNDFLSDSEL